MARPLLPVIENTRIFPPSCLEKHREEAGKLLGQWMEGKAQDTGHCDACRISSSGLWRICLASPRTARCPSDWWMDVKWQECVTTKSGRDTRDAGEGHVCRSERNSKSLGNDKTRKGQKLQGLSPWSERFTLPSSTALTQQTRDTPVPRDLHLPSFKGGPAFTACQQTGTEMKRTASASRRWGPPGLSRSRGPLSSPPGLSATSQLWSPDPE